MFVYSDSDKNNFIKMCCVGCRTDVLLIVINLLITVGCGLITVILESILLKATHDFGGYNGKVKPTEAPSRHPVYSNVMNEYDRTTKELISAETYIFGITIVYVLLDALAACYLAHNYRNIDIIKKMKQGPGPSSPEETEKIQKYQRRFHYWVSAQFFLTLAALCHFIITLAKGANVSYFTVIITLFLICWKSFFLFLFAKKTVYHKSGKKTDQSGSDDFEFEVGNKKELKTKGTKSNSADTDTLSTNVSLDDLHTRGGIDNPTNSTNNSSVSTSGSTSKINTSRKLLKVPIPPLPPPPPRIISAGSAQQDTLTKADSIATAAGPPEYEEIKTR